MNAYGHSPSKYLIGLFSEKIYYFIHSSLTDCYIKEFITDTPIFFSKKSVQNAKKCSIHSSV